MRIGIVLSQTPGYSETFFTAKIRGLKANGFSVIVFAQKKASNFKLCPVSVAPKVHRFAPLQLLKMIWVFVSLLPYLGRISKFSKLERAEGTSWGALLKKMFLNAHILKANLDWLHFGFTTQALGSEQVAKAIGAKMAVSFRGFDINVYPLKNPGCYAKIWKRVDKVHSISNYLLDKAIGMGLSAKTPFQIITPAVAVQGLPKTNKYANKVLQLVTIARLQWIKGLDVSIAAMELLKRAGITFHYHIIGDGSIKDTERYTFYVFEAEVTDQIAFHGKLDHKETLNQLSQADIYLQPSLNEGFCNAVLEAQALGKLTIASNAGGLPENVVDGTTGWLFPVGDAVALAKRIIEVSQLSEEEKELVMNRAQHRVQTNFNSDKQQREFVSFYTNTI